ncbi:MAG TPA: nucleoside-diphosphate sugar epimerase/dehydratase [Dehalococcoidia bacterium]
MTRRIRLALRLHAPSLVSGAADFAIVLVSYALALALRFDGDVPAASWRWYAAFVPLIAAAYVLANAWAGVYRSAWQYGGLHDAVNLAKATALVTVAVAVIVFPLPRRHLPLSVVLISGVFTFLGMAVAKLLPRLLSRGPFLDWDPQARRVLVIGAGNTGQMLIRERQQHREWGYRPVGLVDDDPHKLNRLVHGVPVLGTREDIPSLVRGYRIDVAVLAMPSAPGRVVRETVDLLQEMGVPVRTLPGLDELISRPMRPADLRELTAEDLLGRAPVEIDQRECALALQGKVVLVTGAAGSIGSELARQIAGFRPAQLYLLDNNESGLYDLTVQLGAQQPECPVVPWVADVTNEPKLARLLDEARPQVIFHAAAYKHVPLMEEHPDEAYRVNVLGTLYLCRAARRCGAERFVFISTDKAVDPVSVMGATKRIGERLVRALAGEGAPIFCIVRFVNVIPTRGSVVHTFLRQIDAGGPVAVTHPDAARYFLSVSEAVSLVIQAAAFADDGDIYMLDMGDEIRIDDLARRMIKLRGLRPGDEIPIVYTGLRPGERLREPLVAPDETVTPTRHGKVFRVEGTDRPVAASFIERLERVDLSDVTALRREILALCAGERTGGSVAHGP